MLGAAGLRRHAPKRHRSQVYNSRERQTLEPPTQMRASATTLVFVGVSILAPCCARGADCPPDGNDGLLPTYNAEDQCGDYDACAALGQDILIKDCRKKFDDCAAALVESNARAEAHNTALEACRTSIPNRNQGAKPAKRKAPAAAPSH